MTQTVYASFVDVELAKKAAGALLDRGVAPDRLSVITREGGEHVEGEDKASATAKEGITTTTAADAGSGAAKGAGIGLGVGILAALASLAIPGFGLVLGGGALATAIGGALGASAAGAVSGGALGYLKDQGIDDHVAKLIAADVDNNGAVVAVDLPAGQITGAEIMEVFAKYEGRNLHVQEPVGI